jgi:hypothetical protein
MQTGGAPNLSISWITKKNGAPAIEVYHDDENFQGEKRELFDLPTEKTLDSRDSRLNVGKNLRRLPLAYLDKFLKFKLNDGTQVKPDRIPASAE